MHGIIRFLCATLLLTIAFQATAFERLAPALTEQAKIRAQKDEGAETLYSMHESRFDARGHVDARSYYSVRINTIDAARDYSYIQINYNHYYTDLELEFANVLSQSGEVKAIANDAIQVVKSGTGKDFYADSSVVSFSLPDIEPGSILEFQFKSSTLNLGLDTVFTDSVTPYWFQSLVANDGYRADTVRRFQYTRVTPDAMEMYHKVNGGLRDKPKRSNKSGNTMVTWEAKDIPTKVIEGSMPPGYKHIAAISSSTSENWSQVSDWAWKNVSSKISSSAKVQAVVDQFALAPDATKLEKIKAVYSFLQNNVRYVFAHIGRGGYEPHFPDEVLHVSYGDCKDQTVLAISLLNAVGVQASPALVRTASRGRTDTELVQQIFDHMVVWIPASDGNPELWFDTVGDKSLFPGFSASNIGQTALIINDRGGELRTISIPGLENTSTVNMNYALNNSGQLQVDASMSFTGSIEESMRGWWKHDNQRETSLKKLLTALFNDSSKYTLESSVANEDDLYKPVEVNARFTFNDTIDSKDSYATSISALQLLGLFWSVGDMQTPATRINDYFNGQHFKARLNASLQPMARIDHIITQAAENLSKDYLRLNTSTDEHDGVLNISIELDQPPLDLDTREYAAYYNDLYGLSETGTWMVNFSTSTRDEAGSKIAKLQSREDENSVTYQMALANDFLNTGAFEKALTPAKRAVELDRNNAEAWYVLGVAHGFNGALEESQSAFDKAKSLGYQP